MKRVIQSFSPEDRRTLATFTMNGDKLVAKFDDSGYRADIEMNGIWTMETGQVMLSDGRKFYDALDLAYVNSSRISVIAGR